MIANEDKKEANLVTVGFANNAQRTSSSFNLVRNESRIVVLALETLVLCEWWSFKWVGL